jgi:predicted PurR-regulated permease PerM
MSPFFSAIFWAVVLAILFRPFYEYILKWSTQRQNLAALLTIVICLLVVILPLILLMSSLIQEGSLLYTKIKSGEIHFTVDLKRVLEKMPSWTSPVLDLFHITDISSLQTKINNQLTDASRLIVPQLINFGQNTFSFTVNFGLMLYLLFFFLRDHQFLSTYIIEAIPLESAYKKRLIKQFVIIIRATVKGNLVVAALQGLLGGLIFWVLGIQGALLWGTLMAFLSLLPIGSALIWAPTALYLLLNDAVWQGAILLGFGVGVIGMVDNFLRPILVGKETKMPDYIVLLSTLGGLAFVGLNGFIIGPMIAAFFIATWGLFVEEKALNE